MDARSQAVLEFPAIRERLEEQTNFPPSRRLAERLQPSAEPVVVARALDETDEARAFAAEHPGAGIGAARDIGPAIERATRGGRLDPTELVDVLVTLDAIARLAETLGEERRPRLRELGRELHPLPSLRGVLERSVDPNGELLDSASPQLGSLRRAVRVAYDRLRSRLEELVHGTEIGGALQEPIVTLRNGRYVVPVRSEARGRVRGIVHDQSGSGQTLFVEPLAIVELGNAWREAQLAEQAEIERILDQLSSLVGTNGPTLRASLDALARFDFWAARARLAAEMDAVRAETGPEPVVELLGARHPGLSGTVVPIDVRLGGAYAALVITGPNTGGKTVTLRTLGLLALMHQAGLHVPAQSGSRLPVFRDVFADIGDEQSIAQSLSTFSGHMRSIIRIVEEAGPATLVLLDELGAGTDPTEGSALAQALLDHFIRAGALVAATTHYAELKTYAHNTPNAQNASVDFDLETLSPTFHLTIGLPGTSQAFAIAERLGLAPALVGDARSRLSRLQQEFEATLASIKASQAETADALESARAAEARARAALAEAERERVRIRHHVAARAEESLREGERLAAELRDEVAAARRLIERETITEARLDAIEAGMEGRLERLGALAPRGGSSTPPGPTEWKPGDRAASRTGGWTGRIVAIDRSRGRATLEAGGLRVEAELADLVPPGLLVPEGPRTAATPRHGRRGALENARAPAAGARAERGSAHGSAGAKPPKMVARQLDIRGARVDEALELVDRYLDEAMLAGVEQLTIVHGHGSGALRDAVREFLSGHAAVREWRPGQRGEGGEGATIVSL